MFGSDTVASECLGRRIQWTRKEETPFLGATRTTTVPIPLLLSQSRLARLLAFACSSRIVKQSRNMMALNTTGAASIVGRRPQMGRRKKGNKYERHFNLLILRLGRKLT